MSFSKALMFLVCCVFVALAIVAFLAWNTVNYYDVQLLLKDVKLKALRLKALRLKALHYYNVFCRNDISLQDPLIYVNRGVLTTLSNIKVSCQT